MIEERFQNCWEKLFLLLALFWFCAFVVAEVAFGDVQSLGQSASPPSSPTQDPAPAVANTQAPQETVPVVSDSDPVISDPASHSSYLEFQKILAADDDSQIAVDALIQKADAFAKSGAEISQQAINDQIFEIIQPVRNSYEDFIKRYPKHVGAHLALGSFLSDFGNELEGMEFWETARNLDPKNPAAWNNLAGFYGHYGPIIKSFEYYEKAISIMPDESVYWSNLATMTQLFRKDALVYYSLEDDQAVIRKSLEFYEKAWAMDSQSFTLATDIAQTYYFLEPFNFEAAERAWKAALILAGDDIEREGVHVHQARINIRAKKWDEALSYISRIQHSMYATLKATLEKRLEREKTASENPG